jgi:hypothetical protein
MINSTELCPKYGQIISIETHTSHYSNGFNISGIDYDVLYKTEDGNYNVDHIAEGWLEKI